MKILLCRDLRLNGICTVSLSAEKASEWNNARFRKFERLLHSAPKDDIEYMFIIGHLFGTTLVSGDYIDSINDLIRQEPQLKVITFLTNEDSHAISSASVEAENLHVLWPSIGTTYEDEQIKVTLGEEEIRVETKAESEKFPISLKNYRVDGNGERIPSFEPCGYEDALSDSFGYMITRINEQGIRNEIRSDTIYAYRFLKTIITASETEEVIMARIRKMVSANDEATFVRLVINGTAGVGVNVDTNRISKELMQYVFYAEVIDESRIDLSRYQPENDISLTNEFVRLALNDPSLSEAERSAVIRIGWNALNSREEGK
ncbi:MAG: hypothetical protein IKE28_03435 [Solobacterium sp.]|nr:hypothetical protein [Solobacterium sp.]